MEELMDHGESSAGSPRSHEEEERRRGRSRSGQPAATYLLATYDQALGPR